MKRTYETVSPYHLTEESRRFLMAESARLRAATALRRLARASAVTTEALRAFGAACAAARKEARRG